LETQRPNASEPVPSDVSASPTPRRGVTIFGAVIPGGILALGIVVVFLGGLLSLLLVHPPQKLLCDSPAPDITLQMFADYRGGMPNNSLTLAELKGKPVVLNFWASWCQPCEQEAADLEAAWQQYKDKGVVFVGVDFYDQEPAAKAYLQRFQVSYPNGPDLAGVASKRYGIRGVPETFFIDPNGKINGCRVEGPLTAQQIQQRIAAILPK
jgi:cytochrome c biogenesis protein CcmG/thiol:disulfide interchange protein DsbE